MVRSAGDAGERERSRGVSETELEEWQQGLAHDAEVTLMNARCIGVNALVVRGGVVRTGDPVAKADAGRGAA